MADAVTVKVENFQELNELFTKIRKSLNPDTVEPVLLEAAEMVAERARQEAPWAPKPKGYTHSKHLRESIKAKTLRRRFGVAAPAIAAIDRFRDIGAPHSHLVEFGTKARYTKKGKFTGKMPKNPFLKRAIDAEEGRVVNFIMDRLGGLIEGAMK
jgi:HK97 gp10 family phage protein